MEKYLQIGKRKIGPGHPAYIVAELSANHNHSFEEAAALVRKAKEVGADAVKLQTYTADTITIKSDKDYFKVGGGTLWDGKTLYDLYQSAYTPWEWQPKLEKIGREIGIDVFTTPFDHTAVDFIEKEMDIPVYKVASFEIVDIPLIKKITKTGKPIIMSTGMANLEEIQDAVTAVEESGGTQLALLKCTSAYPAPPEEMNIISIPFLAERFCVPSGLSDHTMGSTVAVASIALGACIIEKHFTMSRSIAGPDSAFSMEPAEFKEMVNNIRIAEKALGKVSFGPAGKESKSRIFRRSLFAVKEIKRGEVFTEGNIRSIRPGMGLAPKYFHAVLGKKAKQNIEAGTPLAWNLIE